MATRKDPSGWPYRPSLPHPRGFDTPALFRADSLERVQRLVNRIRESQRRINRLKAELSRGALRIRQLSEEIRRIKYEN